MNRHHSSAQAMVEFALALPIFLMVIYGLIEASRLVFIYSAVTTASREAARYGSAWGVNSAGVQQYRACSEIKAAAKKVGILLNLQDSDITIDYDHGPGASGTMPQCDAATGGDPDVVVTGGQDRIVVTVTYTYSPIIPIVPSWNGRTISSGPSARTIMGRINMVQP